MSYSSMREELERVFRQNNFEGVWLEGEAKKNTNGGRNPNINKFRYNVPNNCGLNMVINYPGMKTKRDKYKKLVYDYRVDLNGIAISHANIILDLYNKGKTDD